jgi:single-stranded-DNA-specific exonuclease
MVRSKFNPERDVVIVEGALLWHIGVVGIVASRVLREFYRPTLIIGGDGDYWRGSGRSVPGFDLAAALRECTDLLHKHGGHAMAAGVTLEPGKVDALRERLNHLARRALTADQLIPELQMDAEVYLADLSAACLDQLARLEPFGQGNPAIQVVVRRLRQSRAPQRMGKDQQHWKLWVQDADAGTSAAAVEVVWWGAGENAPPNCPVFDIAAAPGINEYNGTRRLQLKLMDWRPHVV